MFIRLQSRLPYTPSIRQSPYPISAFHSRVLLGLDLCSYISLLGQSSDILPSSSLRDQPLSLFHKRCLLSSIDYPASPKNSQDVVMHWIPWIITSLRKWLPHADPPPSGVQRLPSQLRWVVQTANHIPYSQAKS